MIFALAKLFGMDTDAVRARAEGELAGENKVLWEWVRAERLPPEEAIVEFACPSFIEPSSISPLTFKDG
jgi:hypothetical protein